MIEVCPKMRRESGGVQGCSWAVLVMHSSLLARTVSWHVLLGGDPVQILTMPVKQSSLLAFPVTWPKQSDNWQEALTLEVFQPKKSEKQTNFQSSIHFCFDQHLSFGILRRDTNLQLDTGCLLQTWTLQAWISVPLWVFAVVTQHPCACKCEQVVGVTYCDDIQDAEEAVDTISWENLLHHALFAILEARNNRSTMRKN